MATIKPDQRRDGTSSAASSSPVAPPAGQYEIDASRSAVTFRTRHLFGLAPVRGSFAIRAGSIEVAAPVTESRVYVEIEAASFHTGNPLRDGAVRSPRLLDAGQYPVLVFTSGRADGPALPGTLTVRDVTVPVSLLVEQTTISPDSFTARGTVRIDRAQFGVTAYRGLASRYLDMTVEVRAVPR
ncbi:MAG: YceI family protein [Streptosporangiaceae bacterium]